MAYKSWDERIAERAATEKYADYVKDCQRLGETPQVAADSPIWKNLSLHQLQEAQGAPTAHIWTAEDYEALDY